MRAVLFAYRFPRAVYTGVFLITALNAQQEIRNPRTSAEDVAAGAKAFRSHCAACHGYNGEGGRGPNLASGEFHHGSADSDLLANISHGIAGTDMPGIYYEQDKVWQIVAYVRSLHGSADKPSGDANRGAILFESKGCAGCHRVRGKGGALGPDLSTIGSSRALANLRQSISDPEADVSPRYWKVTFKDESGRPVQGFVLTEDTYGLRLIDMNQQLRSYDKAAIKDFHIEKRSPMPSYRETLSSNELEDVVAYLASLRLD